MWKVVSPNVCRDTADVLNHYLNTFHPIDKEVKINWGNSKYILHHALDIFGNKCEAVKRSSDKSLFFSLCKDLGVVPVVENYDGPCFQHRDPYGANGSGIVYVDNQLDFIPGYLSTKEIKGTEYRVYFCYGKYEIYQKALLPDGVVTPVHNSANYGYKSFSSKIKNLKEILLSSAQEVADRLELSYGAIDFIMDKEHTVYVLESNSAPTLFNDKLVTMFGDEFVRRF